MEDLLSKQDLTIEQAKRDIEELKKMTFSIVISCDNEDEKEFVKRSLGIKDKNLKRLYKVSDLMEK